MRTALSFLQTSPLNGGLFRFSTRPTPYFHALPLQAHLGLLFLFLPLPSFSPSPLSEWKRNQFFLTWGWLLPPDSLTTGSHASSRAGLGLCLCRSPTWLSKSHTGPHGGKFGFSPQNEFTPPPKGGGAGYRLSLVCWVFHAEKPGAFPQEKTDASYPRASLGSCLWQLLATTGSHAPNRAGLGLRWCRFPTRLPKPHTGPHRAEFGFTAFSWCASFAEIPQAGTPGGNSLPREWGGSCKATSRFSQCRPKPTRWWAAFR